MTRVPWPVWLFSPPSAWMRKLLADHYRSAFLMDRSCPCSPAGDCGEARSLPASSCALLPLPRTAALPVQSNLPGTLSVCSRLTETLFLFQLDRGVGRAGWEEEQLSLRPDHGRYLQTFPMTLHGCRPAPGIASQLPGSGGAVSWWVARPFSTVSLVAFVTVPVYPQSGHSQKRSRRMDSHSVTESWRQGAEAPRKRKQPSCRSTSGHLVDMSDSPSPPPSPLHPAL